MKSILKQRGARGENVQIEGGTKLSRNFNPLYLAQRPISLHGTFSFSDTHLGCPQTLMANRGYTTQVDIEIEIELVTLK